MDETKSFPVSIDAWTRNEALIPTLRGMGLVVIPIRDDCGRADHLIVSCGQPHKFLDRGHFQG